MGIRKCVHPGVNAFTGGKLAWKQVDWIYCDTVCEHINRKSLHMLNNLIQKEIIHRKKLYIDHEKDPHPTGTISTTVRKNLHNSACKPLINIV